MAVIGIEFASIDDAEEESSIDLVHYSWLTPRKKEVLWPPYKTSAQFKRALLTGEKPNSETWKLYGIKKILFCDGKYIYVNIMCVCVFKKSIIL